MKQQVVRCQIESCRHNSPDHYCQLTSIHVAPCAPRQCGNVANKRESMCASFEKKEVSFF